MGSLKNIVDTSIPTQLKRLIKWRPVSILLRLLLVSLRVFGIVGGLVAFISLSISFGCVLWLIVESIIEIMSDRWYLCIKIAYYSLLVGTSGVTLAFAAVFSKDANFIQ